MDVRVPESLYYHRARGVEVPEAVLHGAVPSLHFCWCLYDVTPHVLPGSLYLVVSGEPLGPQVLHCLRVVYEDRVPRPRHPSLAHLCVGCMLWAVATSPRAHWDGGRVGIRQVPGAALLRRNRCADRKRPSELHQRVCVEGP